MSMYITKEGLYQVNLYKYNGEDCSYIYQKFLSPMADYLVSLCPSWLAPNIITLCGFFCVILSHIMCAFHSPHFNTSLPTWLHVFAGIMVFLNQTFDNMDGKQARRTSSSSPLGLLIDHGCDALHASFGPLTIASSLKIGGGNWQLYLCWLCSTSMFWTFTWEQLWCGQLKLPPVNGATEGMLWIVCVHVFCGYLAPKEREFWFSQVPIIGCCSWINLGTISNFVLCVIGCVHAMSRVMKVPEVHKRWRDLIWTFFPYIYISIIAYLGTMTNFLGDFPNHSRLFYCFLSGEVAMLITYLHLSHITRDPVVSWPVVILVTNFLLLSNATINLFYQTFLVNPIWVLWGCSWLLLLAWLHMIVSVVCSLSQSLKISVFTIDPVEATTHKKHQ